MNILTGIKMRAWQLGWMAIFFVVLAALTFPLVLLSQQYHFKISITLQAIIVAIASFVSQWLYKKPFRDLYGGISLSQIKNAAEGLVTGALLMVIPALVLTVAGIVHWEVNSTSLMPLLAATVGCFMVAIAEELLFRGFVFQRLIKASGIWIAQFIMAGYFLLNHLNNPGMSGMVKVLASLNIFFASLLFGFSYLRSGGLAMPVAIHFMANWVQGTLLGFGVSGHAQASLLKPIFNPAFDWITGGQFGLEASVPGLFCVITITLLMMPPKSNNRMVIKTLLL